MQEGNIEKTTFRVGSSGLYEFTRMPFGPSNVRFSFSHLMEPCASDQWFATLLLYQDGICTFAPSTDVMIICTKMVFGCLKDFHLKIKPKKCHSFTNSVVFFGHVFLQMAFLCILKKEEKVIIGWHQRMPRRSILSMDQPTSVCQKTSMSILPNKSTCNKTEAWGKTKEYNTYNWRAKIRYCQK